MQIRPATTYDLTAESRICLLDRRDATNRDFEAIRQHTRNMRRPLPLPLRPGMLPRCLRFNQSLALIWLTWKSEMEPPPKHFMWFAGAPGSKLFSLCGQVTLSFSLFLSLSLSLSFSLFLSFSLSLSLSLFSLSLFLSFSLSLFLFLFLFLCLCLCLCLRTDTEQRWPAVCLVQ